MAKHVTKQPQRPRVVAPPMVVQMLAPAPSLPPPFVWLAEGVYSYRGSTLTWFKSLNRWGVDHEDYGEPLKWFEGTRPAEMCRAIDEWFE